MRLRTPTIAVAAGLAVGAAWMGLATNESAEEFCAAYANLVESTDERISHGDLVILDHSARTRDPCGTDDLWHYPDLELVGIDGVLFDDCVVSWSEGGRAQAHDLGIQCKGS